MKDTLNITIVQSDLYWEDTTTNLKAFENKLTALSSPTDLIILPEMFTTGFSNNAQRLAESMNGQTIEWMQQQAAKKQAVIAGSFIAEERGRYFNRLAWVTPNGDVQKYDKRHLFTYAGEHKHYQAGSDRLIVSLKSWKICPLICYDLRFPVWSRNTVNYDLLIYVANFPAKRSAAWTSLLIARAIENQTYTIGVNRVGVDGNNIKYNGDSMLIDYEGRVLYQVHQVEDLFTIQLDKGKQQTFRTQYPFLADKDNFNILK